MSVDINQVGTTAFVIAYCRMLESTQPQPLFEDRYAKWFVPEEMRAHGMRMQEILPESVSMIRYRTRLFNDMVARGIDDGMKQIVIVGSGFDMRPANLAADGVTFFDVDQAAVIDYKHREMKRHAMRPCAAVRCNYLDVNLPRELIAAGFDADAPSLFLWEGNTMYLPRARIHDFLAQLCSRIRDFRIGFDYISPKIIARETGIDGITRLADFFEHQLGAPWITAFDDPRELINAREGRPMKVISSGGMDASGAKYAPQDAANLKKFAGLYSHAVLEKVA